MQRSYSKNVKYGRNDIVIVRLIDQANEDCARWNNHRNQIASIEGIRTDFNYRCSYRHAGEGSITYSNTQRLQEEI